MGSYRDDYYTADTRIRLDDEHDMLLWALVLGATLDEVRGAADLVGPDALAVQELLVAVGDRRSEERAALG